MMLGNFKINILFLVLLGCPLFGTIIERDMSFSKILETQQMITTLSIRSTDASLSNLEAKIASIQEIARNSKIATGGQYSISPQYSWVNNKSNFEKYLSEISYEVIFTKEEEYEKLLDSIKTIKDIEISQGSISSYVSSKNIAEAKEDLVADALDYSKKYSDKLSTTFRDTKCFIKSISFNAPPHYEPAPLMRMVNYNLKDSSTVSSPISKEKEVSIMAHYSFECLSENASSCKEKK